MLRGESKNIGLLLIVALPMALPELAYGSELDEIVVTARKRTESLQDVPVAVTRWEKKPFVGNSSTA